MTSKMVEKQNRTRKIEQNPNQRGHKSPLGKQGGCEDGAVVLLITSYCDLPLWHWQVRTWKLRAVDYLAWGPHGPGEWSPGSAHMPPSSPGGKQHLVQRKRTTSSSVMACKLPRTQETLRTTAQWPLGKQSGESRPNASALQPCHQGRSSVLSSSPPPSQLSHQIPRYELGDSLVTLLAHDGPQWWWPERKPH